MKQIDEVPLKECTIPYSRMLPAASKVVPLAGRRRTTLYLSLAASVMLLIGLTFLLFRDGGYDGGPVATAPREVLITSKDLYETGVVEVADSHHTGRILHTLAIDSRAPSATVTLEPGTYWVRVSGTMSASKWTELVVKKSRDQKQELAITPVGNMLLFTASPSALPLKGAVLTYSVEGKAYRVDIGADSYELGPFRKGTTLNEVMIRKDGLEWKAPGPITVEGGEQEIPIKLRNDE
jgi:hypothetical protein